jgi:adenosine kinase
MDFSGRYSEHFVAGRLDNINVSLMVNGLTENLGGTAGNIAYALSLLGEKPRILAAIGKDYQRYFEWLDQHGISTQDIRIVSEEWTASAYITTDQDGNQITIFNPGAMMHTSDVDLSALTPAETIAIVGPGNLQDMVDYPRRYQEAGIFAIFDPGQSLPAWNGDDLKQAIGQCNMLVSNDYELGMINNTTGMSVEQLLGMVDTIVTTKGGDGCGIVTREGSVQVPVVPTDNAIDPTGAGDAFRGGLIKGLVESKPIKRCVEMGTVTAHYVVQVAGTQNYTFTPAEFNATLEQHFGS